MSTFRKCDSRCHTAKRKVCQCWCGGVFHGAGGQAARDAFVAEYLKLPSTQEEFDKRTEPMFPELADNPRASTGDRWRKAITAAVEAARAAQ